MHRSLKFARFAESLRQHAHCLGAAWLTLGAAAGVAGEPPRDEPPSLPALVRHVGYSIQIIRYEIEVTPIMVAEGPRGAMPPGHPGHGGFGGGGERGLRDDESPELRELRREARRQWLQQQREAENAERMRMSREERRALRIQIREAGYQLYVPADSRRRAEPRDGQQAKPLPGQDPNQEFVPPGVR